MIMKNANWSTGLTKIINELDENMFKASVVEKPLQCELRLVAKIEGKLNTEVDGDEKL